MPEHTHAHEKNSSQEALSAGQPGQELPASEHILLSLQRRVGNRAVERMVGASRRSNAQAARRSTRTSSLLIQRQAPLSGPGPDEEEPIDVAGLGKAARTTGHGNTGGGAPETDSAMHPGRGGGLETQAVQRQGGGGGSVTATSSYTVNAPNIIRKPAVDIAAAHGQPDSSDRHRR